MKPKNSNYHASKTLGEMAKKIEIVNDLQGRDLLAGSAHRAPRTAHRVPCTAHPRVHPPPPGGSGCQDPPPKSTSTAKKHIHRQKVTTSTAKRVTCTAKRVIHRQKGFSDTSPTFWQWMLRSHRQKGKIQRQKVSSKSTAKKSPSI